MAQILSASVAVFQLSLPNLLGALLNNFKFFALDLFGFLRMGCLGEYRYADKLGLAFVIPVLLLGCVGGVYLAKHKTEPDMEDRAIRMAFAAVFLVCESHYYLFRRRWSDPWV